MSKPLTPVIVADDAAFDRWNDNSSPASRQREFRRLFAWINDLQSGMYVNCVYCGHRYGPRETTPATVADALKAHVERCPAHPMSALKTENERLKAGKFTPAELQNLCHNLKPDDLRAFRAGCEDYAAKLFGLKKPASEEERQRFRTEYDGQTEPCCECGEPYPRADLIIDGEIYCSKCREAEAKQVEGR